MSQAQDWKADIPDLWLLCGTFSLVVLGQVI